MNVSDINKIVKLLNQTMSEFDAEALSSIRAANRVLKKNNVLWDGFLSKLQKSCNERYVNKSNSRDGRVVGREVDEMLTLALTYAMEEKNKSTVKFLESLYRFSARTGFLTEKQAASVFDYIEEYEHRTM